MESGKMKDDEKVVHVTFNPSKQTEADSIEFSIEGLDELFTADRNVFRTHDKARQKQLVEDFLALGYDDFTAFKLAKDLIGNTPKKFDK